MADWLEVSGMPVGRRGPLDPASAHSTTRLPEMTGRFKIGPDALGRGLFDCSPEGRARVTTTHSKASQMSPVAAMPLLTSLREVKHD